MVALGTNSVGIALTLLIVSCAHGQGYLVNGTYADQSLLFILAFEQQEVVVFENVSKGKKLVESGFVSPNGRLKLQQSLKFDNATVNRSLFTTNECPPQIREFCESRGVCGILGLSAVPNRYIVCDRSTANLLNSLDKAGLGTPDYTARLIRGSQGEWQIVSKIAGKEIWAFQLESVGDIPVGISRSFVFDVQGADASSVLFGPAVAAEHGLKILQENSLNLRLCLRQGWNAVIDRQECQISFHQKQ